MVQYKQHELLMHPLAAKLRELKWYYSTYKYCVYLLI